MKLLPPLCALAVVFALPLPAQVREPFPAPFVVEHHIVDGSSGDVPVLGETVRDTYGGSFLVSERGDGGRTIVDFARRDVTEIRPQEGTYWVLSFSRVSELRRRLEAAENAGGAPNLRAAGVAAKPLLRVEEVPTPVSSASRGALSAASASPKHLRAFAEGSPEIDVWVDPAAPRLTPAAIAAMAEFERSVLGASTGAPSPADLLEAVRTRESGALVVRTRRPVGKAAGSRDDGPFLETVVTKAEPVAVLPPALVRVPEGLRRVPSPLETVVSWAEEEAALRTRGRN